MLKMSNVQVFKIVSSNKMYALVNYEEIIDYYNLPFYKKWFKKCPTKELMEIKR